MKRLLTVAALAAASGCFSVDVAESPLLGENSAGHVVVCNYGWTLFGCVPLVCGNANGDSWCPFTFFKDEIKPEYAREKLLTLAEARASDVEDLHFLGDSCVIFDMWYVPVPWIIVYKETNLSANLVKRSGVGR
ncbi:MAG: hypothetical protein J6T01_02300 [Kiritimatiellae bacterium]|nr:hypothetical protein [Kiritimatiellia bacterium]